MPINIVDLFSGIGGLSYAFANDPLFNIVFANEIDHDTAKAYSLNHPKIKMFCKNIADLNIDKMNIEKDNIDVVLGGPPCQSFSTAGKRLESDPRSQLFKEYIRMLKELSPKIFLFENVVGIQSIQKGQFFQNILQEFSELGYNIKYQVLNAADYGTPQIRKRVIIVGTKNKYQFAFPQPTHSENNNDINIKPYVTLKEAIGDLPFIKTGQITTDYKTNPFTEYQRKMRANTSILLEHSAPNNNPNLVKIMELLPEGGTPLDLPDQLRPTSGFGNTYSKLWWNKACTTITRNFSTPSSARCIHPKAPRPLTTREGARIQGFPDSYLFYGSQSKKKLQIGNAVPSIQSYALQESIKQCLLLK